MCLMLKKLKKLPSLNQKQLYKNVSVKYCKIDWSMGDFLYTFRHMYLVGCSVAIPNAFVCCPFSCWRKFVAQVPGLWLAWTSGFIPFALLRGKADLYEVKHDRLCECPKGVFYYFTIYIPVAVDQSFCLRKGMWISSSIRHWLGLVLKFQLKY